MPAHKARKRSLVGRLGLRRRAAPQATPVPPARPPTVLIVDDVEAIRVLVRAALEPEFTIVGEAADGAEAVASALSLRPDLVLLDLNMPRYDGLEAIKAIRAASLETRVVVLSGLPPALIADEAIALGAVRFVDKSAPLTLLPALLRETLAAA